MSTASQTQLRPASGPSPAEGSLSENESDQPGTSIPSDHPGLISLDEVMADLAWPHVPNA